MTEIEILLHCSLQLLYTTQAVSEGEPHLGEHNIKHVTVGKGFQTPGEVLVRRHGIRSKLLIYFAFGTVTISI